MEQIDKEADQIKEVYARFGIAVYHAQCLERQIAIILSTEYGVSPKEMTKEQYEQLLQSFFQQTFGSLITHLKKTIKISDNLESILKDALEKRNWLMHHYFWERAGYFLNDHGRTQMIDELITIADNFDQLDKKFTEISAILCERYGITKDVVDEQYQKFLAKWKSVDISKDDDN